MKRQWARIRRDAAEISMYRRARILWQDALPEALGPRKTHSGLLLEWIQNAGKAINKHRLC